MKKILLNESEKKAIISEREQAIIKSFAKTFNTIKRIDENELTEERPISARYGDDPSPEQSAGIDKFVKDFLDKKDKEKKGEIKPNDTKISENDGEDYEAASRGVEYGINPYQDQPEMGDNNQLPTSVVVDTTKYEKGLVGALELYHNAGFTWNSGAPLISNGNVDSNKVRLDKDFYLIVGPFVSKTGEVILEPKKLFNSNQIQDKTLIKYMGGPVNVVTL